MMYSLKYTLRNDRVNKKGHAPLYLKYIFIRKFYDIPLYYSVPPNAWNISEGEPNNSCTERDDFLIALILFKSQVRKAIENFKAEHERLPTREELRRLAVTFPTFTVKNQSSNEQLNDQREQEKLKRTFLTLEEAMIKYIENKRGMVSGNTLGVYKTTFDHLKNYAINKGVKADWTIFDPAFENNFRRYFHGLESALNTENKYLKNLKWFMNYCDRKLHVVRKEQYEDWVINSEEPDPIALTELELDKVRKVVLWFYQANKLKENFSNRENLCMRILLFLCKTGLRWSDFKRLTFHDVQFEKTVDGRLHCYLFKPYHKTKDNNANVIPLTSDAIDLLFLESGFPLFLGNDVYPMYDLPAKTQLLKNIIKWAATSNKDECLWRTSHYPNLFPTISGQEFNEEIKEIAKKLKIDDLVAVRRTVANQVKQEALPKYKLMTSKIGRKTFTTHSLGNGIRKDLVMTVNNQKKESTMRVYTARNANILCEAFSNISTKELESMRPKKQASKAKTAIKFARNRTAPGRYNPNGMGRV